MSVQKALLIELFAILLVLYRGFALLSPELYSSPEILHAGFVIGLIGLVYGLAGSLLTRAFQNGS